MDYFYKQPKYYSKFKCIGGDCMLSCCDRWSVFWSEEERDSILSSSCSGELKELIEKSFTKSQTEKELLVINLCDNGRCPFHNTETDLCDIQRELGGNSLGAICRSYPRHFIKKSYAILRWCDISCPAVIENLINDHDALKNENVIARDYKQIPKMNLEIDNDNSIRSNRLKTYRFELLDFFTDLFLNEDRHISSSIILGAIAMKHISEAAVSVRISEIPAIIKKMSAQLSSKAISNSFEEIKPNYQLKFRLINNMTVQFWKAREIGDMMSKFHDGNNIKIDNYISGLEKFENCFKGREYAIKNIITNLFYDLRIPYYDNAFSPFENYAYFVISAASIITVGALIGYFYEEIEKNFIAAVADMSRGLSHNKDSASKIIKEMKALGVTTPAHLALIIK